MKAVALGVKVHKTVKQVEKTTGVDKKKKEKKKKYRDSALAKFKSRRKQSDAEKNLRGMAKFGHTLIKVISKGLITLLRSMSLLLSVCGVFSIIVTSLYAVMLVTAMSGILCMSSEEGFGTFTTTSNSTSKVSAQTTGKSDEDAQKEWLDAVIAIETEMTKQNPKYAGNAETTTFKYDGKEYNWRYDCSGTVSVCLMIFNNSLSSPLNGTGFVDLDKLSGFNKLKVGTDITKVEDLKPGDIMCCSGHVEVVEKVNSNGAVDLRSWGCADDAKNCGKTSTTYTYSDNAIHKGNHAYTVVWRAKSIAGGTSSDWIIYSQGDDRWRNNWHGDGSSIVQSGCGTCATAMVLAHYSGDNSSYTPDKLAAMEKSKGIGTPNNDFSTIPKLINECYKSVGLSCSDYISGNVDLDKLDECLAKGGCAIVDYPATVGGISHLFAQTSGHYVVVTSGNQKDGYRTVDSNNGHETGTCGKKEWTPYSKHTFEAKYIKDAKYYYLIEK